MVISKFNVSMSIVSSMLALLTSGCRENDDQAVWWQSEQNRVELTHDLALEEYRLEHSSYVRPLAQPAKAVGSGNYGRYFGHSTRPTYYYVNDSNRYNFASPTTTPPTITPPTP